MASRLRRLAAPALLLLTLAAGEAVAQGFDLSRILGGGEEEQEAISVPRVPLQSLPAPAFDPAEAPNAEDYARIGAGQRDDAMMGDLGHGVSVFQARLTSLIERTPDAISEISTTLATASPTGAPSYFLGVAVFAGLLLVIGRGVSELYSSYVARPLFVGLQRDRPRGYAEKLPVLVWRVLLTAIGAVLTLGVASGVGLFFHDGHAATLLTVIAVFGTYAAVQVVDTIWRMMLAPFLREYRLPAISDRPARRLYRWITAASTIGIVNTAFCYWVEALGLPREIHIIVTVVLTAITVLALLLMFRSNRHTISAVILSGRARAKVSWMAAAIETLWLPAVTLYLLGTWADLGFRLVMGIEAGPSRLIVPYLILIAGLTVYAVTIFVIERVFRRRQRMAEMNRAPERSSENPPADSHETHFGDSSFEEDNGDDEGSAIRQRPEDEAPVRRLHRLRSMEDLARHGASIFAAGVCAYALLRFWGGGDIFERYLLLEILLDVLDIVFIGYLLFHAVRIWIDRKIEEETADEPDDAIMEGEGGGAGATRLATLLPLVRNAILFVIATAVVLVVATELGVNVAPLFAGAGILGLAIGFGSQTLVRDILSGAFFLMDDAFRRGEYIDVGDVKGTVERISLRSFQLRHHLGMLHTIPFGEIQYLTNFSRDWVMMKLPLRLTYDTDVERVRKLVKKLGQELLQDETVGDKFLAPLKSQGVIHMEDSAMIVRVKFMTRPGDQWVVRKRIYQEIRELFEREGINFAHREVTVRMPDLPKDRPLDEEEQRLAGAAARNTLDVVEAQQLPRTGTGGPVDDR